MIGVMLMQNGGVIKKTWIIFVTCFTDRATNNLDYAEDVNNCDKHEDFKVLTKGGSLLSYEHFTFECACEQ